jgi:predicted O-methyltransferase YrrM
LAAVEKRAGRRRNVARRVARRVRAAVASDLVRAHERRIAKLRNEVKALRREVKGLRFAQGKQEAGHFYSPLPTYEDAVQASSRPVPESLPGIDMNREGQLRLAVRLGELAADQPFGTERGPDLRYAYGNGFFGYDDGLVLHTMLRHLRPKRVVEVGSGWSSACMLDTDELFLDGSTEFVFVDPNPARLESLLRDGDTDRVTIHRSRVQDVSFDVFETLEAGDVLFIDSSHVVKAGSDVLQLHLEVVPRLPNGTFIHVHDIPWPFEYALRWSKQRRWWTEAYLVRALLIDNPRLRVRWANSYLAQTALPEVTAALPQFVGDGLSLWLEVVA